MTTAMTATMMMMTTVRPGAEKLALVVSKKKTHPTSTNSAQPRDQKSAFAECDGADYNCLARHRSPAMGAAPVRPIGCSNGMTRPLF